MIPAPRPQVLVTSARALHTLLPSPAPLTVTLLGRPLTPLALRAYQTGRYVLLLDTAGLTASELVMVLAQTNRDPQALPLVAVVEESDQRAQVLLSGSLACYAIITDAQARNDPLLLLDLLCLPTPAAPPDGVINPLVIGQIAPRAHLTAQEIMVLNALLGQRTYEDAAARSNLSLPRFRSVLRSLRAQVGLPKHGRFATPDALANAIFDHLLLHAASGGSAL